MSKISVIIPIYNVEKFLPRCLDSLLSQTFKDFEVICVNDGSSDNCEKILKKYEKKDNVTWKEVEPPVIVLNLEPGDIIVKEKTLNPIGMFGHVAIMKNDRIIVDYPKFGNKSYTIDIEYWLEEGRDILVLRYKDMTDEFKISHKFVVNNLIFTTIWEKHIRPVNIDFLTEFFV